MNNQDLPALLQALANEREEVRRNTRQELWTRLQLGGSSLLVDQLLTALREGFYPARVRVAVIMLLSVRVEIRSTLLWIRWDEEMLALMNDPHNRAELAGWVEERSEVPVREPLIEALEDADPRVRATAAKALGKQQDLRAVESLLARLQDPVVEVRTAAAFALGRCQDERAVEPLITLLGDAEPSGRAAAARALSRFRGGRLVEPLLAALQDTDDRVRASAARHLGKLRAARAVDPLLALLNEAHLCVPYHGIRL